MCLRLVLVFVVGCLALPFSASTAVSQSLEQARAMSRQVDQLVRAGRYAEALPLAEAAAGAFAGAGGAPSEGLAKALNTLALMYKELLRLDEAEATFDRSLAVITRVFGPDHSNVRTTLRNIAAIQMDRGRLGDCESTLRRALESAERSKGVNSFDAASFLIGLGVVNLKMGRYEEARALYQRARSIANAVGQSSGPLMASALQGLSSADKLQERWRDTRAVLDSVLRLDLSNSGLRNRSYPIRSSAFDDMISTMQSIAEADEKLGQMADAEAGYRRALATAERELGAGHPTTVSALSTVGNFLLRIGRGADAEPLLRHALQQNEALYGQGNLVTGYYVDSLADSLRAQGKIAEALELIQRPAGERDRNKLVHLRVLHASMTNGLLKKEVAVEAAFQAVQQGWKSVAAEAISSLAARFASGTDELAALIRAEQDLTAKSEKLVRALVEASSMEPQRRNMAAERQARQQLEAVNAERQRSKSELVARFPRYAALSRAQTLTLDQVRSLLRSDETLIVYDIDSVSFAWAVSKTRSEWVALDISDGQLTEAVTRIRQSLTFERNLPFDLGSAHDLYRRLFAHFEAAGALQKRLLIVANGALTSLPFQLLSTRPSRERHNDADWLVLRHAIGVLPSVASLASLRQAGAVQAPQSSMIAFADPIFSKTAPDSSKDQRGRGSPPNRPLLTRVYKGKQVDLNELRRLQQLPGTRREVQAISKTMVGPVQVLMGTQATEAAVKRTVLDRFRIVYFATHGLMAGDLKSLERQKAEPALVLTVPEIATADDDGLLQASEIAGLKLDAEWVVLSACNTASSQGPGAEALSGLAQAFFYAGARSLVVSHWDVSDDATATLMADVFKVKASAAGLGSLEAFQQAQIRMLSEARTEDDRHPRRWAPFVVVGEERGAQ